MSFSDWKFDAVLREFAFSLGDGKVTILDPTNTNGPATGFYNQQMLGRFRGVPEAMAAVEAAHRKATL